MVNFTTPVHQRGLAEPVLFDAPSNRSKCGQILQALMNPPTLIDSVLFGPSSNPSKSGHLQAVTNFREKQFRVGSHVSIFLSDSFHCITVRHLPFEMSGI